MASLPVDVRATANVFVYDGTTGNMDTFNNAVVLFKWPRDKTTGYLRAISRPLFENDGDIFHLFSSKL